MCNCRIFVLMQFKTFILSLICGLGGLWAVGQVPFDSAAYAKRLELFIKDDTLYNWLEVRADGVRMYANPEDKAMGKAECRLGAGEIEDFLYAAKRWPFDSLLSVYQAVGPKAWSAVDWVEDAPIYLSAEQGLHGFRIALDPGHVGGTMEFGELEWKFVKIRRDPARGIPEDVAFNEGNLTLATALILGDRLRKAGAEVLLTRGAEGETAFGYSFEAWLDTMQVRWEKQYGLAHRDRGSFEKQKDWERYQYRAAAHWYVGAVESVRKDSAWWMDKAGRVAIYKGPFLRAEFEERARKINAFRPHVTLILHYNVLETNEPGPDGYRKAVPDNYCMAFVPGAYMAGELSTPEDRLNFLIHWLSGDQDLSIGLSDAVVKRHPIPALKEDTTLNYIRKACLPTSAPGVYARNLALTRQIHGVMCFGESLYQDNIRECVLLNEKTLYLKEMKTGVPERVREVANFYYEAVAGWIFILAEQEGDDR